MRRSPVDLVEGRFLSDGRRRFPTGFTAAGVIALLEPLAEEERRKTILARVRARIGSVTLLMDAPWDPHNAAAALRSCDAFGVPELHVVPRAEGFALGRKVTRGTERWVDVIQHPTAEAATSALLERGYELVATHPKGKLVPEDLGRIPRVCLVMGNEHDGISEALVSRATRTVRIPMRGFVESLNLSVAAALLLSAATAERHGDLSENEQLELYAAGLLRSVPRSGEILAASNPR
jgi:tRNA (guanosine-2'-O-)-methyltransferase